MGNHHNSSYNKLEEPVLRQVITEMSASSSAEDAVYEEIVTTESVCCFTCKKTIRRKIVWETKFLRRCEQIHLTFPWAAQIIEEVTQNQLPRLKYYKEVHYLRREKPALVDKSEADILSNPDEVERFKKNLKKSVIISFSQNPKLPPQLPGNVIKSSIPLQATVRLSRMSHNQQPRKVNYPGSNIYFKKNSRSNSHDSKHDASQGSSIQKSQSSRFSVDRDVPKQTAAQLDIFLRFSSILERHLSDMSCILGRIRKLFVQYFQKRYRNPQTASEDTQNAIESIQQFLNLLKDAVMDYYNLQVFGGSTPGSNMFISNEENILSTCTAILFRDHGFYNCLFNLIAHSLRERQANFSKILNYLKGSGPQRFTVKHKFCLNSLTMKSYLNDLSSGSGGSPEVVENIEINQIITQHAEPYKNCMNNLNEMAKSRSPVNKLKSIMACSEGITQEIQKFYDANGLKRQRWMLDADQVLSIFCYLIVGARVQHLHTHLFILDNFASSHQMISMTGYYLSVIRCAVEQLENEFADSINSEKEGNGNRINGFHK